MMVSLYLLKQLSTFFSMFWRRFNLQLIKRIYFFNWLLYERYYSFNKNSILIFCLKKKLVLMKLAIICFSFVMLEKELILRIFCADCLLLILGLCEKYLLLDFIDLKRSILRLDTFHK